MGNEHRYVPARAAADNYFSLHKPSPHSSWSSLCQRGSSLSLLQRWGLRPGIVCRDGQSLLTVLSLCHPRPPGRAGSSSLDTQRCHASSWSPWSLPTLIPSPYLALPKAVSVGCPCKKLAESWGQTVVPIISAWKVFLYCYMFLWCSLHRGLSCLMYHWEGGSTHAFGDFFQFAKE